jgi:hypothetical protein
MDEGTMVNAERQGLLTSVIGPLFVGCNGLVFAWLPGAQAILLDGLFNPACFATGLFTVRVVGSRIPCRGDTSNRPGLVRAASSSSTR